MRYRKKPVVIEAIQFTGTFDNFDEICDWGAQTFPANSDRHSVREMFIPTEEGEMKASVNDFIIRGVQGEYYPCKPDIFEQTYERVEE